MHYRDFHKSTHIKSTRKYHRCCWCGQLIDKGSIAIKHAVRYEGDFWSGRMHVECDMARAEVSRRYGEWYADESWARGRTDDDTTKPPEFVSLAN